ncbi:MAG TPA: quinoprotein dehydrogenase-associated putative ABC transporter substrate-binding protein, partial [Sphingomonas sp.]|uniref:quinoprotein dehydrogenase-associated putative ABC transporter substrate-binding protein n=1 Tax=Sphingomonas sp. TaxID=28214 RepID=UPI002EDB115F
RAEAVDRTALRVCADPASPPLSVQDGSGVENRIAELFARALKVPVRYVWFPSGMGFYRQTLNLRRCDIVMGTAAGNDIAATTIRYYRSTYVLVTRTKDGITASRLDDPALARRSIGVQVRTPAADLMARSGPMDRMKSYDLMIDSRNDSVGRRLIQDLEAGRIDGAILWGPIAAHFTGATPAMYRMTPLAGDPDLPMAYDIAMAVRFGEPRWRAQVDQLIRDHRTQIATILSAARIPLLPMPETKP